MKWFKQFQIFDKEFQIFNKEFLIIDPYTLAAENSIRIVVNAFVDWKKVRKDENVIVYGKVSAPAVTPGK